MHRPSPRTPSLRRHKPSSLGVVRLNGKDIYLGPWPACARKAPPSVRDAYDRVIAEWLANGRRLSDTPERPAMTVSELIVRFWQHAKSHYRRPDGTNTSELSDYKYSLRPLKHLYGTLPVTDFSPLKLKAVRQLMVDGYKHPRYGLQLALSRGVINQRVGRIVRMFKWAVTEELIPETVHRAIDAVPGLERGRCNARETEPVKPVADSFVDAVLPHVLPEVAAMARLQRLSGMRPGEVTIMRGCDLDMTGTVWLFKPHTHKTAYRGGSRIIALGPKAQAIIKPFLLLDTQAFLFSPQNALDRRRRDQRARRRTGVQPSQQNRRKKSPKRQPAERYTTASYARAILRGCERAFPAPLPFGRLEGETLHGWRRRLKADSALAEQLRQWRRDHHFHVHQLRHSFATAVRRDHGLEAAQVSLGHSKANVTEIYAERDLSLALRVAVEIG
jgi:integrase